MYNKRYALTLRRKFITLQSDKMKSKKELQRKTKRTIQGKLQTEKFSALRAIKQL